MTLHEIGMKHGTDKAWHHGFMDFYEEHLPASPGRILEIGVYHGQSLATWREYYPDAEIIGIDIAEPHEVAGCTVLQMNSRDVFALLELGQFDLIIDDGSHYALDQQIILYWALNHGLAFGGTLVMEDLHVNYWDILQDDATRTTDSIISTMEDQRRIQVKRFDRTGDKKESYTNIIKHGVFTDDLRPIWG